MQHSIIASFHILKHNSLFIQIGINKLSEWIINIHYNINLPMINNTLNPPQKLTQH